MGESLGQRVGSNLFHSFERFNVPTDGRATFTGSLGIQNVLARVTGPTASNIDGTLRSTIPGANLYLMNPNGILFGPQARLELSGAFHATTADTIKLGVDGQFNARVPSHSVLTVAPPAAFGFFSQQPAEIKVEGNLKLPDHQQFSLVGGDLTLDQGVLQAPAGRINLLSVAELIELNIFNPEKKMDWLATKLGNITIKQKRINDLEPVDKSQFANVIANVDASGTPGGGLIFIRGGRFTADGGVVYSTTLGDEPGQGIDMVINGPIQLQRGARISADSRGMGRGGQVNITTPYNLSISDSQKFFYMDANDWLSDPLESTVASNNFKTGAAGEVNIQAQLIEVDNGSIQSVAQKGSTGDAGNVKLEANKLVLKNKSYITSLTRESGNGGKIIATADEILIESGGWIGSPAKNLGQSKTGDAGDIRLDTKRLKITGSGVIDSSSWNDGEAGEIFINATEFISISGRYDHNSSLSMIATTAYGRSKGGNIEITTPVLDISEGIIHSMASPGAIGSGGHISLNVGQFSLRNGGEITSKSLGTGTAGSIHINVEQFSLGNGGKITSKSYGTGNAGSISITALDATLNNSEIAASADQAGGGNIDLKVQHNLFLFNSTITAQAYGDQEGDNGGNLTITLPNLFLMDTRSQLFANANAGHGGNIRIVADNFLNCAPATAIDASSETGIDGEVTVDALQVDLTGLLTQSSLTYLHLSPLRKPQCGRTDKDNRFAVWIQEMRHSPPSDLRFYSPVLGE
jgi:filamentous hemagglutinin family protein